MPPKSATEMFDPKDFLAKVGAGKTVIEFHKNQTVFSQGDVADTVFYIQQGKVKLTVMSEQGKEAVVAILEPGQFFGEGCMNGHPIRIATTTAMENCVITVITKAAMIAALHDEPKFSELFMAYLLTRNSRIEEDLIDQLFNSSEKRLARLLLLLANFGKEGSPQPISPTCQSGNVGRDDRHHPLSRQSFHEQVSQARPHQLQRQYRGSQFADGRGLA
jgi:CRP/FNR family cyclic AMP-dependent transcriptional regulator